MDRKDPKNQLDAKEIGFSDLRVVPVCSFEMPFLYEATEGDRIISDSGFKIPGMTGWGLIGVQWLPQSKQLVSLSNTSVMCWVQGASAPVSEFKLEPPLNYPTLYRDEGGRVQIHSVPDESRLMLAKQFEKNVTIIDLKEQRSQNGVLPFIIWRSEFVGTYLALVPRLGDKIYFYDPNEKDFLTKPVFAFDVPGVTRVTAWPGGQLLAIETEVRPPKARAKGKWGIFGHQVSIVKFEPGQALQVLAQLPYLISSTTAPVIVDGNFIHCPEHLDFDDKKNQYFPRKPRAIEVNSFNPWTGRITALIDRTQGWEIENLFSTDKGLCVKTWKGGIYLLPSTRKQEISQEILRDTITTSTGIPRDPASIIALYVYGTFPAHYTAPIRQPQIFAEDDLMRELKEVSQRDWKENPQIKQDLIELLKFTNDRNLTFSKCISQCQELVSLLKKSESFFSRMKMNPDEKALVELLKRMQNFDLPLVTYPMRKG